MVLRLGHAAGIACGCGHRLSATGNHISKPEGKTGLHLEGLDATSLAIAFCGGALALLGHYVLSRDARYQAAAPLVTVAGLVVLVIALACIIAL